MIAKMKNKPLLKVIELMLSGRTTMNAIVYILKKEFPEYDYSADVIKSDMLNLAEELVDTAEDVQIEDNSKRIGLTSDMLGDKWKKDQGRGLGT